MATEIKVDVVTPVKHGPATMPAVEAYVQPSELCDTQRKSMAADAFSALQNAGL